MIDVQSLSGRAACVARDLGPGAEILCALTAHRRSVDEDMSLPTPSKKDTTTTTSLSPPTSKTKSSQRTGVLYNLSSLAYDWLSQISLKSGPIASAVMVTP